MIGLVIATLIVGFIVLGVTIEGLNLNLPGQIPNPYNGAFLSLMALAFVAIVIGAATAWPIWSLLVHAFLPKAARRMFCSTGNARSPIRFRRLPVLTHK